MAVPPPSPFHRRDPIVPAMASGTRLFAACDVSFPLRGRFDEHPLIAALVCIPVRDRMANCDANARCVRSGPVDASAAVRFWNLEAAFGVDTAGD